LCKILQVNEVIGRIVLLKTGIKALDATPRRGNMELQLVVFTLAGEAFGVPIGQVKEIVRFVPVTAVPKSPPSVLGVLNLRGKVVPVVNLRERFGLPGAQTDDATRIIVSDVAEQTLGFVVDGVSEVLRLSDGDIEPTPEAAAGVDASFIRGIGKVDERLIIVLELEKVFDFSAFQALDR
jgi:purine-binding chemotaxis protein CheW